MGMPPGRTGWHETTLAIHQSGIWPQLLSVFLAPIWPLLLSDPPSCPPSCHTPVFPTSALHLAPAPIWLPPPSGLPLPSGPTPIWPPPWPSPHLVPATSGCHSYLATCPTMPPSGDCSHLACTPVCPNPPICPALQSSHPGPLIWPHPPIWPHSHLAPHPSCLFQCSFQSHLTWVEATWHAPLHA